MEVQLISSKRVRARKPHTCQTCAVVAVQPGQEYTRDVYTYDGRAYAWVQCEPCRRIAGEVYEWAGDPWDGIGLDQYVEWAEENPDNPDAAAYLARSRRECGEPWYPGGPRTCGKPTGHDGRHVATWTNDAGGSMRAVW